MATHMEEIIDMRKRKKELYISLLNKGLKDLTNIEKQILNFLSVDEDIQLLLKNGDVFLINSNCEREK